MPSDSRAHALRIKQIAELVPRRMEEVQRNSSLRLHTQKSLAEAIGWSQSTVREDIKDMQALGYPIKFDPRRNGYVFTEKFSGIPTAFITESDLAKLCLAIRALESLKGSPLFRPIQKALDKLVRALTDKFGVDLEALKSTVTFRSSGVDALTDPAVLETLMHAIKTREEIEVVYSKLNRAEPDTCSNGSLSRSPDKPSVEAPLQAASDHSASNKANPNPATPSQQTPSPSSEESVRLAPTVPAPLAPWLQLPVETRKVHPLHILCQDNVWYLYLWDPLRQDKRRFTLSRIHSVARTGKTFRPRKFDIDEELKSRVGVTSGDPVQVRVQFRRKASYLVAERPWHRSQELAPGPDHEWNLELTMEVAHTPELERGLFGYDEDFRVIEPGALKDSIRRKSQQITTNHSSAHPPAV